MVSTVFSDDIVNATDLRKNQKHWLDRACVNPVTVKYGHNGLAIVNREQIRSLWIQKHYTEQVLRYCQEFVEGLKSDTFPWAEYLNDEEKAQFHKELLSSVMKAIVTDNWAPLGHTIEDWKATAETAQNLEIAEQLQHTGTPEEYVTLK